MPDEQPTEGGSYRRNQDGSLTLVERTQPAPAPKPAGEPAPAETEPKPAKRK